MDFILYDYKVLLERNQDIDYIEKNSYHDKFFA